MFATPPSFSFFGTDEFAVVVLETLQQQNWRPVEIITTPDRRRGRGLKLVSPPIKIWAETQNIPCRQPLNLRAEKFSGEIFLVASYGRLIPEIILRQPPGGVLNIHPSLLPRWRGASPIQSAILAGDKETGVSLMQLDVELDHGPIIVQQSTPVENKTYLELRDELAKMGARLFIEHSPSWLSGNRPARPQDHNSATYAPKLFKTDGEINLNDEPQKIWRQFRALNPWPGTYFFDESGKRVIVRQMRLVDGKIVLEIVQPANRQPISYQKFLLNKKK